MCSHDLDTLTSERFPLAEKSPRGSSPKEIGERVFFRSLVIEPCPEPAFCLEELLALVTDENLHGEVETGPPVGREIW
jgi:hypothetical protein